MAAPQQTQPEKDAEPAAMNAAEPSFSQMTSLEELVRYSEETLEHARSTVEALV